MGFRRGTEHLASLFEYEYALLLVPLTLIMAYYNWLSSFQWQRDSKPIVLSAPHLTCICQTSLLLLERYN